MLDAMTIMVIIDGLVVVLAQQLNRVVDTFKETDIRCKLKIKTEIDHLNFNKDFFTSYLSVLFRNVVTILIVDEIVIVGLLSDFKSIRLHFQAHGIE